MKIILKILLISVVISSTSCRKIKDYFRSPDSKVPVETIHSATLTAYAVSTAMAVMNGQSFSYVTLTGNTGSYPCLNTMVIDLESSSSGYPYITEKASAITVIGLWSDANTAIFSIIYTDYHVRSNVLDIVGIETIPAIKDGNYIHIALANQDVQLNPDEDALLSINLSTLQIQSELLRLDMPRPATVYVAVEQAAYLIDVNTNGTLTNLDDDSYTITGGGQLIEIEGSSTELTQQAMVDVHISASCNTNPTSGMSIVRVIDLEQNGLPELGTAVLEFSNHCNGKAHVFLATGIFIESNNKDISFVL